MSDSYTQKISQFLDDELKPSESLLLLNALQQQPELQAKMQRYRLINQAVKITPGLMADGDFAAQLKQKLAQEPTYLLPDKRRMARPYWKGAAALAASVAALAVLAPSLFDLNARPTGRVLQVSQVSAMMVNSTQQLVKNTDPHAEEGVAKPPIRLYPVNKRFNDYLQAHNGSLYTNGAASFQYRTQLASYTQGE